MKQIGVVTDQGARDSQEDRYTVIPSLAEIFPETVIDRIAYFAVFDGHEGAACAEFIRCYLHGHIVRHEAFCSDIRRALHEGFAAADRQFLGPPIPAEDPLSLQYTSGCTGVVALVNYTRYAESFILSVYTCYVILCLSCDGSSG